MALERAGAGHPDEQASVDHGRVFDLWAIRADETAMAEFEARGEQLAGLRGGGDLYAVSVASGGDDE
jgi:hypothetical protein